MNSSKEVIKNFTKYVKMLAKQSKQNIEILIQQIPEATNKELLKKLSNEMQNELNNYHEKLHKLEFETLNYLEYSKKDDELCEMQKIINKLNKN